METIRKIVEVYNNDIDISIDDAIKQLENNAMNFIEFVAESNYELYDVSLHKTEWKNEIDVKTTQELLTMFNSQMKQFEGINKVRQFYLASDIEGIHNPRTKKVELNENDLYKLMYDYSQQQRNK